MNSKRTTTISPIKWQTCNGPDEIPKNIWVFSDNISLTAHYSFSSKFDRYVSPKGWIPIRFFVDSKSFQLIFDLNYTSHSSSSNRLVFSFSSYLWLWISGRPSDVFSEYSTSRSVRTMAASAQIPNAGCAAKTSALTDDVFLNFTEETYTMG